KAECAQQLLVGAGMDESRTTVPVQRVDRHHIGRCGALAAAIKPLQQVLQDVAVVLYRDADDLSGFGQTNQQILIDRRHVDDTHAETTTRTFGRAGKRLMNPSTAADDARAIVGAFAEYVSLPELEDVILLVKNRGW